MMEECPFASIAEIRTIEDLRKYVEWRRWYISAEVTKERDAFEADKSKHKHGRAYFHRAGMHSEIITIQALLEQVLDGEMNRSVV